MQHEKVVPQHWMLLPKDIRQHLATVFNIGMSGVTEIRDQEVITDGRTLNDLAALSAERMAEYVGSTESFARLFELTVAKAHSELHPPVGVIMSHEEILEEKIATQERVFPEQKKMRKPKAK